VVRGQGHEKTDFEIELLRLDKDISELEDGVLTIPIDAGKATSSSTAYFIAPRSPGTLPSSKP
jgi:hypothetical protein